MCSHFTYFKPLKSFHISCVPPYLWKFTTKCATIRVKGSNIVRYCSCCIWDEWVWLHQIYLTCYHHKPSTPQLSSDIDSNTAKYRCMHRDVTFPPSKLQMWAGLVVEIWDMIHSKNMLLLWRWWTPISLQHKKPLWLIQRCFRTLLLWIQRQNGNSHISLPSQK